MEILRRCQHFQNTLTLCCFQQNSPLKYAPKGVTLSERPFHQTGIKSLCHSNNQHFVIIQIQVQFQVAYKSEVDRVCEPEY